MARSEVTGRKPRLAHKISATPVLAPPPPSDLLAYTVPEAGRLLGLSRNSAYDAAARGDLPVVRIGGRLIVPQVALMRLLESAARDCRRELEPAAGEAGAET